MLNLHGRSTKLTEGFIWLGRYWNFTDFNLQNIDFSNKSCTLVQSEIGIELNSIILSSVRMAAKYLASYILIRRVLKVIYYLFTNPKWVLGDSKLWIWFVTLPWNHLIIISITTNLSIFSTYFWSNSLIWDSFLLPLLLALYQMVLEGIHGHFFPCTQSKFKYTQRQVCLYQPALIPILFWKFIFFLRVCSMLKCVPSLPSPSKSSRFVELLNHKIFYPQ